MTMTTKRSLQAILTVLALVVAACGTSDGEGSTTTAVDTGADGPGALTVVATTTMLGDLVRNVTGEEATVEVLVPVGADPHDFQASSQQVSTLSTADLVVANGLGLEEGLHDVLEGAESDGAHVMEIGAMLNPLPFGEHDHEDHEEEEATESCDPGMAHEHEDEEHEEGDHDHEEDAVEDHDHDGNEAEEDAGHAQEETDHDEAEDGTPDHEHGSCDPHVWMDPLRMADAARLVADELDEVAPDGSWSDRAAAYVEELEAANGDIEETFSGIPEEARVLVTNHEAFGYFAELYGFEVVGVVVPGGSTLGDPSSSELADLVDVIVDENVPAIFTDSSAASALAESIAEEAGDDVAVVELFSGSLGEPESGADTLIGMLTTNAQRIADALS